MSESTQKEAQEDEFIMQTIHVIERKQSAFACCAHRQLMYIPSLRLRSNVELHLRQAELSKLRL